MTDENDNITKALSIPQVKVVDDWGHPANIDNYDGFMQFVMLAAIAGNINKIRKHIEAKDGKGWTRSYVLQVTDRQNPPGGFDIGPERAVEIDIHNDGPGMVWAGLGDNDNPTPLMMTESIRNQYPKPTLRIFYLRCDQGRTAQVRVTAKG
jgi:hypothetical protein